jgi:trehalose-6-phosphate synthase
MDIVSYRGPGMAGGVSAGLARVWGQQQDDGARWWYVDANAFTMRTLAKEESLNIEELPEDVIKGHYRYCNAFLWPLMHDLPQHASFSASDRRHYQQFNMMFAQRLSSLDNSDVTRFVQDYQLALMPGFLNIFSNNEALVFWHIPWPKKVDQMHVPPLAEVARGLLGAKVLGFHTQEYAENFMRFVKKFLPGFAIDEQNRVVVSSQQIESGNGFAWKNVAYTLSDRERPLRRSRNNHIPTYGRSLSAYAAGKTQIVVAPLGLDLQYWDNLGSKSSSSFDDPSLDKVFARQVVLSVDRADYTKAVAQRLKAIDRFFSRYPQYRGEITVAQICGKTRMDVPAFDRYWNECRSMADDLNSKYGNADWKPLVWLDQGVSCDDLGRLYARADVMLVNPVRDGLNLTAKEYVACRRSGDPGVLLLSRAAGCWHELQPYAMEIEPQDPEQIADTLAKALQMPKIEKDARMFMMKRRLQTNTLQSWWTKFAQQGTMPERETRIVPDSAFRTGA